MNNPKLHDGELHAYATCFVSDDVSAQNAFHHNLVVSCLSRMPRFDGAGCVDFSSNTIVNPGKVMGYDDTKSQTRVNFYSNLVWSGPNTAADIDLLKISSKQTQAWCSGNTLDGQPYTKTASPASLSRTRLAMDWATAAAAKNPGGPWPQHTQLAKDTVAFVQKLQQAPRTPFPAQFRIQSKWVPVSLAR